MTKELQVHSPDKQLQVTQEQIGLVKSMIFPDATDAELKLYVYECQRRGVHPLDRKIFPIKRNVGESGEKKLTFQTSIDFMRSEGDDGTYAGMDEPVYGPAADGYPEYAKVAVYRWVVDPTGAAHRIPFVGIARWKEYYPGEKLGFMWRKMPFHMLGKCAEALARRMAWPQKLDKLYLAEEIDPGAADPSPPISATVRPVKSILPSASATTETLPSQKTPSESRPAAPGATKGQATVNDTLQAELDALTPDMGERERILRQLSSYTDETGQERFIAYERIGKTSNRWAGKVLGKLREYVKTLDAESGKASGAAGHQDCSRDPRACDWCSWETSSEGDVSAYCTDKQGTVVGECPYAGI